MAVKKMRQAQETTSTGATIIRTQTLYGRISHWLIVPVMTGVILTGLYITHPFFALIPMRQVRYYHLILSAILSALVLARVYYALVTGDVRNFLLRRGDGKKLVQLMAYYFFLRQSKPYEATKYNVGQRLIYSSWVFVFLLLAILGLILAAPERPLSLIFARLLGDLQMIRLLKYILTIYFISTIFVHVYLSLTSDPAKFQAIFTGYVRVKDGKTEQ